MTSSIVISVVSIKIASAATDKGANSRLLSFLSLYSISFLTSQNVCLLSFSYISLNLLSALSSTDAVKKIFIFALGKTYVPISRPSIITLFFSAIFRCNSTSFILTLGTADTSDEPFETSGVLIKFETSSPFSITFWAPLSSYTISISIFSEIYATLSQSSVSIPSLIALSATTLYIAPVSRYSIPNILATCLAIVLLPAPAGPSIAILINFPIYKAPVC